MQRIRCLDVRGGGNPITPIVPSGDMEHPVQYEGGPPTQATPPLAWRFTEPVELLDEGWEHTPATIATSITFSAELYGTRVNEFKGNIYFSVDGKQYPFQFQGNIFTTVVSGLGFGIHNSHLLAASAIGEAARIFEFEVLDKAPEMQLGLGIDDGKLYISLPRPMPLSQLADISRWAVSDFSAEKQNITVLAGNDTVVIELSERRTLDDREWLQQDLSPRVSFNSSLGIMNAYLLSSIRPGQAYDERSGQVYGCEKGTVYPLGSCNQASDWDLDRTHLISEGKERREILNAEAPTTLEGCPWGGGTPWANCQNYAVSQFNWALEDHLNPQTNWDAQYDTLDYSTTQRGYFGAGFPYGHWQHYDRNRGYFVPSTCRYRWESRVDCHNCDGNDPYGYESKGFRVGEDIELETDTTCPVFDDENGIVILPGDELNDYVQNTLIPELSGMGVAYAADGTSNLWSYYWSRCGSDMDEWLEDNPGGLCVVVRAKDEASDQGQWIHNMLSIDMEVEPGIKISLEDEQLHYFYVDFSPYASTELSEDNWPRGANCNSPLPTDGYPNGEYSCWIIRAGTCWIGYHSVRLRIKDGVNNWTRSYDLVAEGERQGMVAQSPEINVYSPGDTDYDKEAKFIAELSGPFLIYMLKKNIEWFVLRNGVEYDVNSYPLANYESVFSQNPDDWKGPTFRILNLRDCRVDVRARLRFIKIQIGGSCVEINISADGFVNLTNKIEITIEPGAYTDDNGRQVHWIDGPAIPIFETQRLENPEWDIWSLEHIDLPWFEADQGTRCPYWNDLRIGKIKVKVCVLNECFSYYRIYAKGPNNVEYMIEPHVTDKNAFCINPKAWPLGNLPCGAYTVCVEGFRSGQQNGFMWDEGDEIYLKMVEPSDLARIAKIYEGDYYKSPGGTLNPHSNPNGTVDCCNLITLLLRRLGRPDELGYPIPHIDALAWRDSDRMEEDNIPFNQLRKGDIIVWMDTGHVGIFDRLAYTRLEGGRIIYYARIWEAYGHSDTTRTGGVGRFVRELGEDADHPSKDLGHWHIGRRFRSNDIFDNCP